MKGIHAIVIGVIVIFGAGLVIGGAMATDWPSIWEGSTISDAHDGMMGGDDYMMGAKDDCHDDEDWYSHMHSHSEEECYDDETGQFHIDGDDCHDDKDWYSHLHNHMHSHSEEECHEDVIEQP